MKSLFYTRLMGIGCVLGALGVIIGAFGAHFLKIRVDAAAIEIIRTGVLYLFIHVLAILFVVILGWKDDTSRMLRSSGLLFVAGILLFTGSLLIIGTQSITGMNFPYVGALTPIGGLCFIAGWGLLSIYAFSGRSGKFI